MFYTAHYNRNTAKLFLLILVTERGAEKTFHSNKPLMRNHNSFIIKALNCPTNSLELETRHHTIHKNSFTRLHKICTHLHCWLLCTQCVDSDWILMCKCVQTAANLKCTDS